MNYEKEAYDLVLNSLDQPNGVKIVRVKEALEVAAARRTSLWKEIKECLTFRGFFASKKVDSSDLIGDVSRALEQGVLAQKRLDKMVELTCCGRIRMRPGGGCWQLLNGQEWEDSGHCTAILDAEIKRDQL